MERKSVKPLSEEMLLVQLEDFVTTFDNKMKRETQKDLKALAIALIPFAIGVIGAIITTNPLFLVIGTGCLGCGAIIKMVKDDRDHDKAFNEYLKSLDPKNKIVHLEDNEPVDLFVHKPIVTKKASDYYSEGFKSFIASNPVLPPEEQKPVLEVVGAESGITSKDEIMKRIVYEHEIYCHSYNIPPISIKPKEWDALFEAVNNHLKEIGIEEKLYECMSFLLRYTLAYSLVHNIPTITIYTFINQLVMLVKIGFTNLDIEKIMKEINNQISSSPRKVVNLDRDVKSYKKENNKKPKDY